MNGSRSRRPHWQRGLALVSGVTFVWSFVLATPVVAFAHRVAPPRIGVRTLTTREMERIVGQVTLGQVPQAGNGQVNLNGTEAPSGGASWDIVYNSSVIANNTTANGWSVASEDGDCVVSAPGSAVLGNYKVRVTGPLSGTFDVVQPATSVHSGPSYRWEAMVGGVNTLNGNRITTLPVVGWTARGGMLVQFTLVHNSHSSQNLTLGNKWTHSYDIYLVGTTDMTVHWGNDLSYKFTKNMDGSYTAPTGIFATLVKNGNNTYTLTTHNQTKYDFNTSLRLATIKDAHDNTITLGYSGNNVVTVTDPSSRVLTIGYTSGKITSITDPTSRVWNITYDGTG